MYILTYSTLSILLLYFGPGKAVFFHDSCAALMGFLVPEIQSIFTASGAPKELTSKPSGSSEFRSFMGLGVYMLGQEAESVYDDGFRYVASRSTPSVSGVLGLTLLTRWAGEDD